jgi:hypothetical protein
MHWRFCRTTESRKRKKAKSSRCHYIDILAIGCLALLLGCILYFEKHALICDTFILDMIFQWFKWPPLCRYYDESLAQSNSSAFLQHALELSEHLNQTRDVALLPSELFQVENHLAALETLCFSQVLQHASTLSISNGLESLLKQTVQVQVDTAAFLFDATGVLSDLCLVMETLHVFLALTYSHSSGMIDSGKPDYQVKTLILLKATKAKKAVDQFNDTRLDSLSRSSQALREKFQSLSMACAFHLKLPIYKEIAARQDVQDELVVEAEIARNEWTQAHLVSEQWTNRVTFLTNQLLNLQDAQRKWDASGFSRVWRSSPKKELDDVSVQLQQATASQVEAANRVLSLTARLDECEKACTQQSSLSTVPLNELQQKLEKYGSLFQQTSEDLRQVKNNVMAFRIFMRRAVHEEVPFGDPALANRFSDLLTSFFQFQQNVVPFR